MSPTSSNGRRRKASRSDRGADRGAGSVVAGLHHHRSRRSGLPVRAVPQSRTGVDADFDIDFVARRDEVITTCASKAMPTASRRSSPSGSFLRGARRAAQRRPGAQENTARPGRQARQARAPEPAHPVTLKQAVADEARLPETARADEKVARMRLAIAERLLSGLYSFAASTHAAGVCVISDRPLIELGALSTAIRSRRCRRPSST